MKIHQLRYIHEVANRKLNVSEAADALFTSQPGVSKQIRLLEEEIGVPIFVREGKRLTEITPAGTEILARTRTILHEIENIKHIGQEYNNTNSGPLTIATTHTQARYVLPPVINAFLNTYPNVKLFLKQGYPAEITQMVIDGEADIAIATDVITQSQELIALPCAQWNYCALTLPGHPLLSLEEVTIDDIAQFPLITYDFTFAGRTRISESFTKSKRNPNVVLTALDSDVIKTYVRLGLGVGLVAAVAYNKDEDSKLAKIPLSHLFKPSTTWLGVRRSYFLRSYVYDFIEMYAPHLKKLTIRAALRAE